MWAVGWHVEKEWNFIEPTRGRRTKREYRRKITRSDEFRSVIPDPSGSQSVTRPSQRHISPKDPADDFERLTI